MTRVRRWRLACLWGALALLAAAALDPQVPGPGTAQELLVVIDITQSMAVADVASRRPDGSVHTLGRLDHAREVLGRTLALLPCGTRLGWGVFTAHRSFVLVAPVEVCQNYQELLRTLARVDHRMAWTGNSEVAKGLDSALIVAREMPSHPALVFVTDGHEAPPINPRYRPPFHGARGDVPGLVLGVGSEHLSAIPKLDAHGKVAGTWRAGEVLQVDPRTAARTDAPGAGSMLGATPGREHLSSLREDYLRLLADETGLRYARLEAAPGLRRELARPALARAASGTLSLRWPLCAGALVLLLGLYLPRADLRQAWRRFRLERSAARSS